jgi:hypothetical protein
MTDSPSAPDLRRWAAQCVERAHAPACADEDRARLLKMSESLMALAESADWLAGVTTRDGATA